MKNQKLGNRKNLLIQLFEDLKNYSQLTQKQKKTVISNLILFVSLFIIIPIMITHMVYMFGDSNHMQMPFWFQWFSFVLCSFVVWANGYEYYIRSFKEIFKWHRLGMATLIAVGSLVSYFYSFYPLIVNTINYAHGEGANHYMDFFDSAAMIVTIVSVGDMIADSLKVKANDDLEAVAALQVSEAVLYNPETKQTTDILTKDIKVGDLLLVRKGAQIPTDGIVYSGTTEVDESMLTGESRPIHKKEGSVVIGSTSNLGDSFIMQATKVGKNTMVSSIISSVKRISAQKPSYQKMVDKVSAWFTPTVILLALLAFFLQAFVPGMENIKGTFSYWLDVSHMDRWSRAVFYAVSVLSIACPCALGLAAPLATLVGASKAAKNGIIINHAETYEKIKKVDVVVFDKTGTLTEGKFTVSQLVGDSSNLGIIYQLEAKSMHPLAVAFIDYCQKNQLVDPSNLNDQNIQEVAGVGLKQEVDGNLYEVTSLHYVENQHYAMSDEVKNFLTQIKSNPNHETMQSLICFSKNQVVENVILLEDKISENAYDVINILHEMNIETVIISGDNENAVKFVADKLGIKQYYANTKPEEKADIIATIQQNKKFVAYVGDGINDLVALKQADLSIAINKDNSIANAVSDVLILNHDILSILKTIMITKVTRKMIIFNLIWAFAYNAITLPLSILGFIPVFIGVFVMASSDITVVSNTLLFKVRKIRYITKKQQRNLINKKINPYL